jgi:hypothetical protein
VIARADELDAGTRAAIEAAITGEPPREDGEVGVQGRAVVLLITVPSRMGRART